MMSEQEVFALCDQIREISFALHKHLRHGHLEKVYENGLVHRLRKSGIEARSQLPIRVHDEDGELLGVYEADIVIESCPLIIEVKACQNLIDAHIAQLLGYLRACRIEHGLLINFGAPKLQIKKLILSVEA